MLFQMIQQNVKLVSMELSVDRPALSTVLGKVNHVTTSVDSAPTAVNQGIQEKGVLKVNSTSWYHR